MHARERIVIYEDGADLTPDVVTREPVPPRQLGPVPFAGTGPTRGDYESAVHVCTMSGETLSEQEREAFVRFVEYIGPGRRAA